MYYVGQLMFFEHISKEKYKMTTTLSNGVWKGHKLTESKKDTVILTTIPKNQNWKLS